MKYEHPQLYFDARPLFRPLEQKFITLLHELDTSAWDKQTIASQWKVKDVASHLLDGNLRVLSMQRDMYFGEVPVDVKGYNELVDWLNQLNADWVQASKRLSPGVLTMLHETTGPLVCDYYENVALNEEAIFSVDWAGESKSLNWKHLAREYTEKWLHQQQIRDAIGNDDIMTNEYFHPCLEIFFLAMPHTFRKVKAPSGSVVEVKVTTEAGGIWYLEKEQGDWALTKKPVGDIEVSVEIPADIAWKLFSKSIRPPDIRNTIKIEGNILLGEHVLNMVSVMA